VRDGINVHGEFDLLAKGCCEISFSSFVLVLVLLLVLETLA
jgi:hypothetical protein